MPVIIPIASLNTYVNQDHPDASYAFRNYLVVGNDDGIVSGENGLCRAWMRFDISSIPPSSTISLGQLNILEFWMVGGYGSVSINIKRSTDSFTSEYITWNTANNASVGATEGTLDLPTAPSGGLEVASTNIAAAVQAALASGFLTLRLDCEPGGGFAYIQSKHYSGAGTPKLAVGYTTSSGRRRTVTIFPS